MFKHLTAVAMLLLLPFTAQADIAGDIQAGLDAETVISNALQEGKSLDTIIDELAQVVGSQNIQMFIGPARRAYARQTGASPGDASVGQAVARAVNVAAMANYAGTETGRLYAGRASTFVGNRTPGGTPPGSTTGGSGGGGGQVIEDALCEAAGSEPGCLDG